MRSLRAMGEGGWRTQSDLHALGKVESNRCQACFEDEGTFLHRCVGCSARAEHRKAHRNQSIIKKAQRASYAEQPLSKYGVPIALPRVPKPLPKICYFNCAGGKIFTVWGFCDGSLRRKGRRDDNRGCWSAMICDTPRDVRA